MTETPPATVTVNFEGIEVTAGKDRIWHVEAAGRSASAPFLDRALELVLPGLSSEEQDSLLIQLLLETTTDERRAS